MNVVLYTIDCPNCIRLENKLNDKNIQFVKVKDIDTFKAKGYGNAHFPILEVDGVEMGFKTAMQWANNF